MEVDRIARPRAGCCTLRGIRALLVQKVLTMVYGSCHRTGSGVDGVPGSLVGVT